MLKAMSAPVPLVSLKWHVDDEESPCKFDVSGVMAKSFPLFPSTGHINLLVPE